MSEKRSACPYCGASLPAEAAFCHHCIQSIRSRQALKVPSHLWRKTLKWAVGAVVLAAVALGLYRYGAPDDVQLTQYILNL